MSSYIGVDLGGTKVAVAALRDGRMSESKLEPTSFSDTEELLRQLDSMVEEMRDDELAGVGVGVPSVVDFVSGRVVSSVNVPLVNVPLRKVLGERFGVPAFVDNDATVAALAEAHDHDLKLVAKNLVMFTIGTGVGGGIVINGRIYRGSKGGAGEVGHTIVGGDLEASVPAPGTFPQPGSLERLAAGHALDRLAEADARAHPDSALGRLHADGKRTAGAAAVNAAREHDPEAERIVRLWAERLGIGIANAINTFDPDEVVIGGGAAAAGELLIDPARAVALGYVHPGLRGHARIRLARHGLGSGVLGAALLAAQELEAPSHPATMEVP